MNTEQGKIRQIRLLDGEEIWLALDGRYGLVEEAPPQNDCLVLTNQRLIAFVRNNGQNRNVMLSIQDMAVAEVTNPVKSMKPLVNGGLLVICALTVAWVATAFDLGTALAWLIEGILMLLAAVTASAYFIGEETAAITFRSHTSEVTLPLRTPEAMHDSYSLAHKVFQAKVATTLTLRQGRYAQGIPVVTPIPGQETVEPAQTKIPEPPADAPTPDMTPDNQDSTQSEGRNDV